ncbi:hypothetical protein MA16_Dca003416 [Dendrobium catenatum]|uniref:Uncharacterized protein n=1 Tax=Dendrobium catenatum TaxID=906689 RepID=A0A2I0XCP2_9ASPA|nr:hypothetical protein MA16_Dca003416 [Dendrobium catenatum]
MVMLWDWETGLAKLSFHSGHSNNVFQAKFMPYTDERTMVTCAADGEVHLFHFLAHNFQLVDVVLSYMHQRKLVFLNL